MHNSASATAVLRPLRRARILSLILLVLIYIFIFRSDWNTTYWLPSSLTKFWFVATPNEPDISQACKIPEIDLYHKSFVHMIKPSKLTSDCTKKHTYPLLFNSTVDSELVPVISIEKFHALKIKWCCYRHGSRARGDEGFVLTDKCYPISLEHATKIPKEHEFIAIFCKHFDSPGGGPPKVSHLRLSCVDAHAFVPMKAEVEKRLANLGQDRSQEEKYEVQRPSVAIIGLDAVAKANLLRTMPKTHKYLVEVMEAVDMQGYNKVGDHTLPNLAKLLTSRSWENLSATCAKRWLYEDCPFIWKDFAKMGYVTAFAEDNILSTFNRPSVKAKGFVKQPTDYYYRTFVHISDRYFRKRQQATGCQGPRLFYKAILDYLKKFMVTMNRESKPFFFFSWEGSLTHDDLNDAQLADEPTLRSLTWMHENNVLDNIILILMADHGQHQGKVLKYRQGQLEDRLPPLYFVFPKWFKDKYTRAFRNFQGNMRRFTHTLDVYYTLKDILNLDQLEDEVLVKREEELKMQFRNENITGVPPPLGISMFLPMPLERTCRHTFIEPEYCICTMTAPVDVNDKDLMSATHFALREMNKEIRNYEGCTALVLKNIMSAQWSLNMNEETTYEIHFATKFKVNIAGKVIFPEFNAKVQKDWRSPSLWKMVGNVTRAKVYANYSWCMPSDGKDHPYCFCT